MEFLGNGFDLWVFISGDHGAEYLLLRTSQAKADKYFNGSRFWQIPSDFVNQESVTGALTRELHRFGLTATSLWAVEHAYTFFNPRYEAAVNICVFAAEVPHGSTPVLDESFSEFGYFQAHEAAQRLNYRGLREGLHWLRAYITEVEQPSPEFRLTLPD